MTTYCKRFNGRKSPTTSTSLLCSTAVRSPSEHANAKTPVSERSLHLKFKKLRRILFSTESNYYDVFRAHWPSPVKTLRFFFLMTVLVLPLILQFKVIEHIKSVFMTQNATFPQPDALETIYWPPTRVLIHDSPVKPMEYNEGKVSVVIVNDKHPTNVKSIIDSYAFFDIVDDILVLDRATRFDLTFRYTHPKVNVVHMPEVDIPKDWQSLSVLRWALSVNREYVLLHSDTKHIVEDAIVYLVDKKTEDPDRLVCFGGREITYLLRNFHSVFDLREAKPNTFIPVCSGDILLTDKRFVLETIRWAEKFELLRQNSRFVTSCTSIVHSLAAIKTTGKLHHVLPLHPKKELSLPGMYTPTVYGHPAWTVKNVANQLKISVYDLRTQQPIRGMLISSMQDMPMNMHARSIADPPYKSSIKTFKGTKNICIVSLFSGKYTKFGKKITRNHQSYASWHGYPYWVYQGRISGDELRSSIDGNVTDHRGGAMHWQKLIAIKNIMRAKDGSSSLCKWVMWIDSDAFFTNFNKLLEPIIEKYSGRGETPPLAKTAIFSREEAGGTSINSGVFFVRNSLAGHRMMEALLGMYPDYKIPTQNRGLHDQDAIQDYVFGRMPETQKYNIEWDDMEDLILHDLVVVRQRVFNSFDRLRLDNPNATWHPCDHVAHISASSPERRQKRFAELNKYAQVCPA